MMFASIGIIDNMMIIEAECRNIEILDIYNIIIKRITPGTENNRLTATDRRTEQYLAKTNRSHSRL